jgi:hypothetical protein
VSDYREQGVPLCIGALQNQPESAPRGPCRLIAQRTGNCSHGAKKTRPLKAVEFEGMLLIMFAVTRAHN